MNKVPIFYRALEDDDHWFFQYHVDEVDLEHDVLDFVAEEIARDYHDHYGGNEATWPLTFALHMKVGGPELARFKVQQVSVPTFQAARMIAIDDAVANATSDQMKWS